MPASMVVSHFVCADVSVGEPRKLIIFIIQGNTRRIQSITQSIFYLFWKQNHGWWPAVRLFFKLNVCLTLWPYTYICWYSKLNYFRVELSDISAKMAVVTSVAVLANTSVWSPRRLIMFIMRKNVLWVKVSQKLFHLILKTKLLMVT